MKGLRCVQTPPSTPTRNKARDVNMTGPHVSRAVGAFPRGLTDCSANDVLSISVCICSALLYVCAPRLYSQPLTKPYPGHRRPLHSGDCTRTLPHDVVSVYVNTSLSSHAAARRHRATLVIRGREHRRAFSLRRCPRLPPLARPILAEAFLPDFADLGPSAHEGARRASIS